MKAIRPVNKKSYIPQVVGLPWKTDRDQGSNLESSPGKTTALMALMLPTRPEQPTDKTQRKTQRNYTGAGEQVEKILGRNQGSRQGTDRAWF